MARIPKVNLRNIPFLPNSAVPWIIWGIAALFYFYDIALRIFPSTIQPQFIHTFNTNAVGFSIFTACYYFTYTPMQLPVGFIVDRISIYRILLMACIACLFGIVLIHYFTQIHMANAGRLVIGFGSAFAYVGALKVASIWLPPNRFGLAATVLDAIGMLGGIFVDTVLENMNHQHGFRHSEIWLLGFGVVIALLILFVLKDRPMKQYRTHAHNINVRDNTPVMERFIKIIKHPQTWLIGIIGCLAYLPASVLGDVWGIPFLKSAYHLTEKTASLAVSTYFLGWILASPLVGHFSDKNADRRRPMLYSLWGNLIFITLLIAAPYFIFHHTTPLVFVLCFAVGIASSPHPLVFALAKEHFQLRAAGSVIAVINSLVMIGGAIYQPLTGFILDYTHGSLHHNGIGHYTLNNYALALSSIPISLLVGIVIMHFVTESGGGIKHHQAEQDAVVRAPINLA